MSKIYNDYQLGFIKSLLAQPDTIPEIVDIITPEDIEDVNLQRVYSAILDLHLANEKITLAGIAVEIEKSGAGIDPAWLFQLDTNMVDFITKADPATWAKLVKSESTRSKVKRATVDILKEIDNFENSPLELLHKAGNEFENIARNALIQKNLTITDSVNEFFAENQRLLESGEVQDRIPSPYPSLDYYTNGWGPGQLITIGARTSVGKTTFAMNCINAALQADKSVLFFSLEMNERELFSRLFASLAMIEIGTLERGLPLSEDEQKELAEARELVSNSKLSIETESNVTVDFIKSRALQQAQSANGLDMIVIDYLQLITGKGRSRQEIVAEISRNLKVLASNLNIPIMVLVQLNREERGAGAEDEQIPRMRDIRESGAIAQDSNIVVLLHRNIAADELVDPKALFILEKNRQGATGKFISVRCMLECNLFLDEGKRVMPQDYDETQSDDREHSQSQDYGSDSIPDRLDEVPDEFYNSLIEDGADFNDDYNYVDDEDFFN